MKWNLVVLTVVVLSLVSLLAVPMAALAGGNPFPEDMVSCSAFFDFPRNQDEVSHRAGGKPWSWKLRWWGQPTWEYYGETETLGVPNGYILETHGQKLTSGQVFTRSAYLWSNQNVVTSVPWNFPTVKYNAAWMAGGYENYWFLVWDMGPAWVYAGPEDIFGVPPNLELQVQGIRYKQGQIRASYVVLRPAGPLCNAP